MAYRISLTQRNAAVKATTDLFDKSTRPAVSKIRIYSDATSQPTAPESAVPGGSVILCDVSFSIDAFSDPVTGTGTATGLPLQAPVINSGTAAWFRFYTGEASPAALGDGTVTATGDGGDMTFNNIVFVSGGTVSIAGLSVTIPM